MKKSGSQLAANLFIISMELSIENALGIIIYHLARLFLHKGDGTWQLDMYNDFEVPANKFISLVGLKSGDSAMQKSHTFLLESVFSDMSINLKKFDTLTRAVHDVDTSEYSDIWFAGRSIFYQGSYNIRLTALEGLANRMSLKNVPLGAAAVTDYHASIKARFAQQQDTMGKINVVAKEVEETRQILIKKLYKNCGGLIFHFGDDNDCQSKVSGYFPLNLLGDRSSKGHNQLIVPKGDFRKVCIHIFKAGEKVEIIALGADVWISTADDADHPIASGYKAVNGTRVSIDPLLLGDLSKKYIMATNVNLTDSCDLIFNIVKG